MAPAAAHAQVTSDLVDWNLTESLSIYGGNTYFHLTSYGQADFRWLDAPNKTTVISANTCTDLANLGSSTIAVNDTNYRTLFSGGEGLCFVMRGRTSSGSGSMVNHDGRVRR